MSKKYTLNKEDLLQIAKVLGYTCATALVSSALMVMQETEVPVEYATYAVVLNIVLVSLKKFLAGTQA